MSKNKKTYIIAEVGINHNGSLENCHKLIEAASDAGCDCVKFQFFKTEKMYPVSAGRLEWRGKGRKYSYDIYEAVRSFEIPDTWIDNLLKYCVCNKIDFLCSVFDGSGAGYLIRKGMKMIKFSSYTLTNLPLIEECAKFKLPIIMSTGGAALGEIEEAVKLVNKYHNKLSLLHCSLKYPIRLSECNLGIIETLRHAFPANKIGYSDHTEEISSAAVQAVYLGAEIIEKHITLDKNMNGPDHFFALEPQELKKMVRDIRKAEENIAGGKAKINKKIYGTSKKEIFKHEEYLRNFCFASIFAGKNIKKGDRIKYKDLRLLRSGNKKHGLYPKHADLFKKYKIYAAKNITKEEAINWEGIFNA